MVLVPEVVAEAVTTPVVLLTVATDAVLLLQVPPVVASLSVVVVPGHNVRLPLIAAGDGLTVSTDDVRQPDGKV